MREDVIKIVALGLERERAFFFQKAQDTGLVEFINGHGTLVTEKSQAVQEITQALKFLRSVVPVKQTPVADSAFAGKIVPQILQASRAIEQRQEEGRMLLQEIARVEVFGDFSKEAIAELEKEGHCVWQYFHARQGTVVLDERYPNVLYIGSENGLDYFIAINKVARTYPELVAMQVELPLGELKRRYADAEKEIRFNEKVLKELNQYNAFLHRALLVELDAFHLNEAQSFVDRELDETLFVVEGWVARNKFAQFSQALSGLSVHMEEVAVEEADRVPTYLENKGTARLGEDLVNIYDTPSTSDRDPSLWVLWAFAFFFAVIISDAGYGLLFLLATLYAQFRYKPRKSSVKRFLKLSVVVFSSCLIWGVVIGSFFGIELSPDSPLRSRSLTRWFAEKEMAYHIQQQDDFYQQTIKKFPDLAGVKEPHQILLNAIQVKEGRKTYAVLDQLSDKSLFELALFIGTIHIMLSLLRYLNRNWAALGWVVFMVGGYLYFPSMLNATSFINTVLGVNPQVAGALGIKLIYGGIAGAMVLALIQKKLEGILEIMVVIQIFGDVLSYLRLYALALAGAIVAKTFNDMALSAGLFFGFFIIVAGHAINIVLGLMSGVIHGLRLNFLEWYHYSFEGGGKLLQPLRLLQRDQ